MRFSPKNVCWTDDVEVRNLYCTITFTKVKHEASSIVWLATVKLHLVHLMISTDHVTLLNFSRSAFAYKFFKALSGLSAEQTFCKY